MEDRPPAAAPELLPGERLLWKSARGGVSEWASWNGALIIALSIAFGLLGVGAATAEILSARAIPFTVGLSALLVAVVFVRVRRAGAQDMFFITDLRVMARRVLVRSLNIALKEVRSASKRVVIRHTRHGSERVDTDCVELTDEAGRAVWFGPTPDVARACDLINLLVSGEVSAGDLPALAGEPSPAERRTDVLVARTHRIDGIDYGLLVVGPAHVIRFAEALPVQVEARLFQALAAAKDTDEATAAVAVAMSDRDAGYVQRLERGQAQPHFEGDLLVLRRPEGEHRVELAAADRERLRGALLRAAHPFRG